MQSVRAALLSFDELGKAQYVHDALVLVQDQRIVAAGAFEQVKALHGLTQWQDLRGHIIAPGFVDTHIHYPQTDVIGSPADGLLPWLENYTFPHEAAFNSRAHADAVASFFCDELMRNGVTTPLTFATSHVPSVEALFAEAQRRKLRLITGKVLQDRNSPDGVRDDTEQSLIDTEALIQRWHGVDRLGYAITPRFAPTSTEAQLRGAGELAAKYPSVWIQSHVAENLDEIAWVKALFPHDASYLAVYANRGLMRERAVYAHCIHFTDDDRLLMQHHRTAAAVSPTSNLFLGSGFFDFEGAQRVPYLHGLASDVGGGMSFSPFATMRGAYMVGREGQAKPGLSLSPERLWWLHTAGAAQALDLTGLVGNVAAGCEADFVVLDPQATPLLARRTSQANTLAELLFAMIVLGDDRLIAQAWVAGSCAYVRDAACKSASGDELRWQRGWRTP